MKLRKLRPDLLDAIVFFQLVILVFMRPSLSFGRSVGVYGTCLILFSLAISFVIAIFLSRLLIHFVLKKKWKGKTVWAHHALSAAMAALLSDTALMLADARWKIGDRMLASQIEYFCVNKYSHDLCVKSVLLCPDCARQVDRWKREPAAEKLKLYRSTYPKQ